VKPGATPSAPTVPLDPPFFPLRISTVQKNNIFKMQDPNTGVIFVVNCLDQPTFASCANLKVRPSPSLTPKKGR
jgi:hypothetical protein